ncbi:MAG: amidohydrolase family protein [Planctomycetota bacterium]|jgi:predicted TIM-barrel fold metal-dependent hydrolase
MLIDVNAFFGHWPYWPLPHTSGESVLGLMDRFGIDRAAMASLRGLHGDWQEANAETLALTLAHPDRLIPIACMSPMKGGGGSSLRELVEQGFCGIRLYPLLLQGYSLRSQFVDEVCSVAGELEVPVIVPTRPMMNYRFPTLPFDDIADLAQRHPQTPLILSGPNYLLEFQSAIEAMQRCPNMVIEISCMQGFQALARMVEAVGADRVLFGTGLPLHYPACNLAKLQHAKIPENQRQSVGSKNALRLFGLGA